jgi:hypothetical protein
LTSGVATADDVVLKQRARSSGAPFPFVTADAAAAVIEEKIDGRQHGLLAVAHRLQSLVNIMSRYFPQTICPGNAVALPYTADDSTPLLPRDILVQNRSHRVDPFDAHHLLHAQLRPLAAWLRRMLGRDAQFPDRFVLFGEWVVARHSIGYARLAGPVPGV